MELLHNYFFHFLKALILFCEVVAVSVIVIGVIQSIKQMFAYKFDFDAIHHLTTLSNSILVALNFLLCAELCMTMMVNNIDLLVKLSATLILRIIITLLLHYENKNRMNAS